LKAVYKKCGFKIPADSFRYLESLLSGQIIYVFMVGYVKKSSVVLGKDVEDIWEWKKWADWKELTPKNKLYVDFIEDFGDLKKVKKYSGIVEGKDLVDNY
jgi:hypothetical protein